MADAMKNRVRIFTEGIMIMVSPVLLAIASGTVELKTSGSLCIPLAAAFTLEAGIFPFLCLCLSKNLADLCPWLSRYLYGASKVFIHLCTILLMTLACGIFLFITKKNLLYLLLISPFALIIAVRCICTVQNEAVVDEELYGENVVEVFATSVEFSSTVTAIVFLGLEGLALEGHNISSSTTTDKGLEHMLIVALWSSSITCVVGVIVMLLGTVPQLIRNIVDNVDMYCRIVEILNAVLALFITTNVVLITTKALKEVAWLLVIPPLVSLLVWIYMISDNDGLGLAARVREEARPASMELIKVTFTGFLAVSVPTFSDSPRSSYTHAFILLTAAAVITGLGWRLLTHGPEPEPVIDIAANIACFCAHLCVAAAVVPFASMAVEALK